MRTNLLITSWVLVLACGPVPGGTASDGSSGSASASSSTNPTTGATSDGSSGTDASATGGGTGSGTGTTTGTTTTTSMTTTGATTGTTVASTTAATSETTTGGPGPACAGDGDCELLSDCCTCAGVHVGEEHPVCDQECKAPQCQVIGVDAAICRFGVCITERLSCDATKVACDKMPPPCPPGQVAETSPICWTGKCVPAEHCDVVPDCALCPADWMCVQDVGRGPQGWPRCEPIPADCGGVVDCDCVGDKVCADPFPFCAAQGNHVDCECINC